MVDNLGFNPPSGDPADEDSLPGTFKRVLAKFLQGVDDCLPAVVIAYDRAKNRATVQPLVMMGTTGGEKVSRAQVAEVPVFNIGGGGFVLSFPLAPGDFGWLKATDRDLSLILQGGVSEEWPNTKRMHSFQDGFFLPDVMRQWILNAEDEERAVLQTTDGATRIAIAPGLVKITATDTLVNGKLHVTGDITTDADVKAGAITLKTHVHTSATAGTPTSGPIAP